MALKEIKIPDIGDYSDVEIIEINVEVGDTVEEEDSLMTLETDKASMEIPAPYSGVVKGIHKQLGEKVSEGVLIVTIDDSIDASGSKNSIVPVQSSALEVIKLPDIGDYSDVEVIEVNVAQGDIISKEDSLITLETDKASMEIPSPFDGEVSSIVVNIGDKISKGHEILTLSINSDSVNDNVTKPADQPSELVKKEEVKCEVKSEEKSLKSDLQQIHASPAVRRLARILGADLAMITATGPKGRITKSDCELYIKNAVNKVQAGVAGDIVSGGLSLLKDPEIDFSKFGDTEKLALTKINKLTSKNLHRNWVKIPHVTFYDDADITDLEAFRKSKKAIAEKVGVKMTPLVFLIKAAAQALKEFPRINSSLSNNGEELIIKKYFNIGVAVDTPNGLVVPVIKNVDSKSLFDIAREFMDLVKRGREGKIKPDEMQGACFTISSLGVLGTSGFTPIINMPEVAIIGVSKSEIKPVWNGNEFIPKLMLPLSLSVDHRVIDGALAAKFLTRFSEMLTDLREILL